MSDSKQEKLAQAARHVTVFDDNTEAGARVYAEALLNVVSNEGNADAALDELDEIVADIFVAHPDYARIITSPTVADAERDRMLVSLLDGRALPTNLKFLRVLSRHGRLGMIEEVAHAARALWNQRQNRRVVHVQTAEPLDDAQNEALKRRLEAMLGARLQLDMHTDPTLLGGLIVQVGDVVYDSSVRTQLGRMRRQLVDDKLKTLRGALAATAVPE